MSGANGVLCKSKGERRRLEQSFPSSCRASDQRRISNVQCCMMLQAVQGSAIHYRMCYVESNSDVAVRQHGAVFDNGIEIDFRVTLNVAAARNEAVGIHS